MRTYARPLDGVDEITARIDGGELVIDATKTVRATDPYLAGHFPDVTLYPAIFLLDGIRQAVGAELHRVPALHARLGDWLELGTVKSARVLRPMLDGDELHLHIRVDATGRAVLDATRADGTAVAKMTVDLVGGESG